MEIKRHLALVLVALLVIPLAARASEELPSAVKHILAQHKIPQKSISLYVKEVGVDEPLYQFGENIPRNPASVMKLVTTFAALDLLTPVYTWETQVLTTGSIRDGILQGDLYLRGGGDPYLTTESFWLLLQGLRQRGIRDIHGDIVIDETGFEIDDSDPGAFDGKPLRIYNGKPSAMLVNFWATRFIASATDDSVIISADPPSDYLEISNKVELTNKPCSRAQRHIVMHLGARRPKIVVEFRGKLSKRCSNWEISRAVVPRDRYVHGVFRSLWRTMGGDIKGADRFAPVHTKARLLFSHRSRPLAESIRGINKFSNNLMARQLLMTLAANAPESPARRDTGATVIQNWLVDNGIDIPQFSIDNGAGLSRTARITARGLGRILELAYNSQYRPEFLSSFALAGMDGLLTKRFVEEDITGRARMKTGLINDVRTIAGYLLNHQDKELIVVFLINHRGIHHGSGTAAQNALLRWLYQS